MTHRSSMVSLHFSRIFHYSTSGVYRCTDMAVPLPHHGRSLLDHLHPVHHPGRNFRPLTSRSLLTRSSVPIIDNPEPDSRSRLYPIPSVHSPHLGYGSGLRYSKQQ